MPVHRTYRIATVVVAGVIALIGCGGGGSGAGNSGEVSAFPVTVDNCGKKATVFQRPQKIMTVGNIAANLVYAAGGADRVVVRAGPHDGPLPDDTARAITGADVLDDDDPSKETIIASGADTIISYGLSNADGLAEAKISSLVVSGACGNSVGSWNQVYEDIGLYGRLLGTEGIASREVDELKQRVASVEKTSKNHSSMTAAAVSSFAGDFTTDGNQSIMHAMINSLNLTNVFADVNKSYIEGNLEELLSRDPEVIILAYGWNDGKETFDQAKQAFLTLPGIGEVEAVKNDRIIGNPASRNQNDQVAVDGLESIAEALGRADP